MAGAILLSVALTLAGQPAGYWLHPETALRGDGLSIHEATNHVFEFFLGQGWPAYLGASLVYVLTALLVVSVLPRAAALIAIFAFIFGHYYGASNWLAVRWHLGVQGPNIYGAVLGACLAFPTPAIAGPAARRLRWIAAGALLVDGACTLLGQPASYWQHPATVMEGNSWSRFFLERGSLSYCAYILGYAGMIVWLGSVLPRRLALASTFAFIFGAFGGASNWFFYVWRLGMETPVLFGLLLGSAIVWAAFTRRTRAEPGRPVAFQPISWICRI